MLVGKIWGSTRVLIQTPFVEAHHLRIAPNSRCSMHAHRHKWNAFLVLSGVLAVIVKKNDYDLTDRTILRPGDFSTVKPGEYHRFESLDQAVEAIELYYPEALSEDIVRQDCGSSGVARRSDQPF